METLFLYNKIDLSAAPALKLVLAEGFSSDQQKQLLEFEAVFQQYINPNEIYNYETAEQLLPAFEEFLEAKGLVSVDDENEIQAIAMITSVTQITLGSKATLLIELTPSFDIEDDEDDSEFESSVDDDDDEFSA